MAKILQPIHALRCRKCNGYGFLPRQSILDWHHQAGEDPCADCNATGTQKARQRLIRARQMGKQKSMTLADLEKLVRNLIHDRGFAFELTFNADASEWIEESAYHWYSDDDRDKAIDENRVWRIEIYSKNLQEKSQEHIILAASSLTALVQMLQQYDFEDVDAVTQQVFDTKGRN